MKEITIKVTGDLTIYINGKELPLKINTLAELSKKQRLVFEHYQSFIKKNGSSPSYSSVGMALGKAPSVIYCHVENLCKKKYLKKIGRDIIEITT